MIFRAIVSSSLWCLAASSAVGVDVQVQFGLWMWMDGVGLRRALLDGSSSRHSLLFCLVCLGLDFHAPIFASAASFDQLVDLGFSDVMGVVVVGGIALGM